jgi:hypothetical protein
MIASRASMRLRAARNRIRARVLTRCQAHLTGLKASSAVTSLLKDRYKSLRLVLAIRGFGRLWSLHAAGLNAPKAVSS